MPTDTEVKLSRKEILIAAVAAAKNEIVCALCDRRMNGAQVRRKLQAALDACCEGCRVLDSPTYQAVSNLRDSFDEWLEVRRLARPARQQASGYRPHDVTNAENALLTKLSLAQARAKESLIEATR